MSEILVITGATGKSGGVLAENIGKHINEVHAGFKDGIRAVVRETSDIRKLEEDIPTVEIFKCDLTQTDVLERAFYGADTVLHIAGIHWSREVVDAAAKCNIRRLIAVHTTGIYSKYKEAGEEYRRIDEYVYAVCKNNNILLTILRPTMIYGNMSDKNVIKFIKMVDKFPVMPVINGAKYELQPVHYADLGNAYYQVLMNEEKTNGNDYVLSGGEPIKLCDMLSQIGDCLGKKVRFISFPFWFAYFGAVALYYLSFKKIDFREKVQRLCEPRVYAHDDAEIAFGYEARNFSEGVRDEVRQYLNTKI